MFVVADGRARVKPVTIDRQIGDQVVIAKGLEGNEQVVIEVPPTLAANSPVLLAGEGGRGKGKGKGKGKAKPEQTTEPGSSTVEPSGHGAAKTEETSR